MEIRLRGISPSPVGPNSYLLSTVLSVVHSVLYLVGAWCSTRFGAVFIHLSTSFIVSTGFNFFMLSTQTYLIFNKWSSSTYDQLWQWFRWRQWEALDFLNFAWDTRGPHIQNALDVGRACWTTWDGGKIWTNILHASYIVSEPYGSDSRWPIHWQEHVIHQQ